MTDCLFGKHSKSPGDRICWCGNVCHGGCPNHGGSDTAPAGAIRLNVRVDQHRPRCPQHIKIWLYAAYLMRKMDLLESYDELVSSIPSWMLGGNDGSSPIVRRRRPAVSCEEAPATTMDCIASVPLIVGSAVSSYDDWCSKNEADPLKDDSHSRYEAYCIATAVDSGASPIYSKKHRFKTANDPTVCAFVLSDTSSAGNDGKVIVRRSRQRNAAIPGRKRSAPEVRQKLRSISMQLQCTEDRKGKSIAGSANSSDDGDESDDSCVSHNLDHSNAERHIYLESLASQNGFPTPIHERRFKDSGRMSIIGSRYDAAQHVDVLQSEL